MNQPLNPARSLTDDTPDAPEPPKEKPDDLNPEDFPSGDEEDREDGHAGPEEKRRP